jgi:hypothetical protein
MICLTMNSSKRPPMLAVVTEQTAAVTGYWEDHSSVLIASVLRQLDDF